MAVDWLASMQQTFEYYVVDPATWKDVRLLNNVKSCTINRDSEAETLGSATIDVMESVGECYIRVYLVTIQNGIKERHPLGTYLVQTPSSSFNGRIRDVSMDAYTPLLELKEKMPPIGYLTREGENTMDVVYRLTRENVRAPVVKTISECTLPSDFLSETNETWLSYLRAMMAQSDVTVYSYNLDEMGRIIFTPHQRTETMQPIWTYDDNNSSILYPDITMNHDLYGIPNVVEVVYSSADMYYHTEVVNDDSNSPTSIQARGRRIVHRVTDPNIPGTLSDKSVMKYYVDKYAEDLLKSMSSVEYTVTYSHGYCPVRVGDCVRLNYSRAGITNIKAKVISQSINCTPGCPVSETAVFTNKLWR